MITTDLELRQWTERAFAGEPNVVLAVLERPDIEQFVRDCGVVTLPSAEILIVDLDRTRTSPTRFWTTVRMFYPKGKIVAVKKPATSHATAQAALHARVEVFLEPATPEAELRDTVCNLYQGIMGLGYTPVIEAAIALFDSKLDSVYPALQLDTARYQARIDSRVILLTSREFELLAYLAKRTGRMVAGEELLREVWKCPPEAGGTEDQVKSCVKRLRRKVEPDPKRPVFLLSIAGMVTR